MANKLEEWIASVEQCFLDGGNPAVGGIQALRLIEEMSTVTHYFTCNLRVGHLEISEDRKSVRFVKQSCSCGEVERAMERAGVKL